MSPFIFLLSCKGFFDLNWKIIYRRVRSGLGERWFLIFFLSWLTANLEWLVVGDTFSNSGVSARMIRKWQVGVSALGEDNYELKRFLKKLWSLKKMERNRNKT